MVGTWLPCPGHTGLLGRVPKDPSGPGEQVVPSPRSGEGTASEHQPGLCSVHLLGSPKCVGSGPFLTTLPHLLQRGPLAPPQILAGHGHGP